MSKWTSKLGAAVVALGVWGAAAPAAALQFDYLFSFPTGVFGPDRGAAGEGTPRGIAVGAGGNLLIADSLDDQIYETDASGTLLRNLQTNPYCQLLGSPCVPSSTSAGFATDIAYQVGTGNIWLFDDHNSGAALHELDGDGLILNEYDISHSLVNGGGMIFDSRNGDLLLTDGNSIVRLDETDPGGLALAFHNLPGVSAPAGITEYAPGLFLVIDPVANALYEYSVPTTNTAATLLGSSTITGIDLSTTDALGVAWDASSQRLYITDNNLGDEVHVFALVPEPASGALLALGLAALGARRRIRR